MGVIFARFRKAPDSSATKLEAIVKEIANIEESRRHNQHLQKKIVASLVIYSILIYLVASILFFVYYFPGLLTIDKFIYSLPLLVFPVLVYGIKKFLHWHFVKKIADNDLKLTDLKSEKNKIIEDVMENETYKKATEILEKFAPSRLQKLEGKDAPASSPNGTPIGTPISLSPGNTDLRQRSVAGRGLGTPMPPGSQLPGPRPNFTPGPGFTPATGRKPTMQQHFAGAPPGPPLPRQVLPRERTYMDKLVDVLVGDGPQNRFALICKYCHSHNGMALAEEFDYLGFRCCYCFHMNEARRTKPNAPQLNLDTTIDSSEDEEALTDAENHSETENLQNAGELTQSEGDNGNIVGTEEAPRNNGDKKDN